MKMNQKIYLEALNKELDNLLDNFPELKKYQEEIDLMLVGVKDPEKRCTILISALMDKLRCELLPAKSALKKIENQLPDLTETPKKSA